MMNTCDPHLCHGASCHHGLVRPLTPLSVLALACEGGHPVALLRNTWRDHGWPIGAHARLLPHTLLEVGGHGSGDCLVTLQGRNMV